MMIESQGLPGGYMGQVLFVDLSTGSFYMEPLEKRVADLFLGGRGLGIYYLFRHYTRLTQSGKYENAFQEVDPLSADSVIILSTSPATGSKMPTSGRMHMNFKSPLTNAYGSTNAGGRYGVDLKKTGLDAIIITGAAPVPTYLVISNKGVDFLRAGEHEDLDSVDTRICIKEMVSKNAQVLTIGPGGKNRALYAAVMTDKGKALGRGGGGAVWGAKNLYAVAVVPDPDTKIDVADREAFNIKNENGAMYHVKMKLDLGKFTKKEDTFGILSSMGSLGMMGMVNNFDQLIHNNMRDTRHRLEDIQKIDGEALRYHYQNAKPGEQKLKVKKGSCFNCPIFCKRETILYDENDQVIGTGEGPEFESATLLGANLSIYDLITIERANALANRYALDTISMGSTIASFFELYETIKLREGDLNDYEKQFLEDVRDFSDAHGEPGFGKKELLIPLVHLIGKNEGIGKQLAMGSFRFCKKYGHEELSMTIKKQELPAYDPRTSYTQALSYEMSNRGGCHLEGGYTAPHAYCAGYSEWPGNRIEGTPLISKNAALKNTILDIICACAYGSFSLGLDEYAALINGVTGQRHNSGTLQKIAHRTLTLERCFNLLCGLTDADDWLPDRFYEETIQTKEGQAGCDREAFLKMHHEYYHSLGWSRTGQPTRDTLEELHLTDLLQGQLNFFDTDREASSCR